MPPHDYGNGVLFFEADWAHLDKFGMELAAYLDSHHRLRVRAIVAMQVNGDTAGYFVTFAHE
jgi:hypothetical protein